MIGLLLGGDRFNERATEQLIVKGMMRGPLNKVVEGRVCERVIS